MVVGEGMGRLSQKSGNTSSGLFWIDASAGQWWRGRWKHFSWLATALRSSWRWSFASRQSALQSAVEMGFFGIHRGPSSPVKPEPTHRAGVLSCLPCVRLGSCQSVRTFSSQCFETSPNAEGEMAIVALTLSPRVLKERAAQDSCQPSLTWTERARERRRLALSVCQIRGSNRPNDLH